MSYYVYIIQSERDGSFYKGFTEDYNKRLEFHNKGASIYTSRKIPWKLVYVEEMNSKRDGLIREKNLKKGSRDRILAIINSNKNILTKIGEVGEWLKPVVC